MKKIFCAVCIVLVLGCISGCRRGITDAVYATTTLTIKDEPLETSTAEEYILETRVVEYEEGEDPYAVNERHADFYANAGWMMDEGLICIENNKLYISSIDYGEKTVFCTKTGCNHKTENYTVYSNISCMAGVYNQTYSVAYYEGRLYYFVGGGNDRIVCMDLATGERQILVELPYRMAYHNCIVFNGDYIYTILKQGDMGDLLKIVEIDIRDGACRNLTKWDKIVPTSFDVGGNTLYYASSYIVEDKEYRIIYALDINSLEERIIIDSQFDNWSNFIKACDGDSYYYRDRMGHKLGIKNVDGTIERILVEGGESGLSGVRLCVSGDGLMYRRIAEYSGEVAGTWFKDSETDGSVNITAVVEKYNIEEYDGYYEVFYGKDDKGNYIAYSRDKILGEAMTE